MQLKIDSLRSGTEAKLRYKKEKQKATQNKKLQPASEGENGTQKTHIKNLIAE